ncbi:hypothetical protein RJT34_03807 [Clitoria ternatea]|uniref:Uncharacterized protein n=1 Tax=Clitoria ternatea TaxID=43366 RepID=A0AAN9KKU7_CLITE
MFSRIVQERELLQDLDFGTLNSECNAQYPVLPFAKDEVRIQRLISVHNEAMHMVTYSLDWFSNDLSSIFSLLSSFHSQIALLYHPCTCIRVQGGDRDFLIVQSKV